jgi:hypothetical protein
MILKMLKSLYPTASENVLMAVVKDLENLCQKQTSTEELVDWIDKLVIAHTICEILKIKDDSKPDQNGDESSFDCVENEDEEDD